MPDAAASRLLDLSRLVSRVDRTQTGIDRVELAYLEDFLTYTVPVFRSYENGLGIFAAGSAGLSRPDAGDLRAKAMGAGRSSVATSAKP